MFKHLLLHSFIYKMFHDDHENQIRKFMVNLWLRMATRFTHQELFLLVVEFISFMEEINFFIKEWSSLMM